MEQLELFYRHMEEQHKQIQADFGVADKVIHEEDAKLWRFAVNIEAPPDVLFFNPVPVYVGDHLTGFANVVPDGEHRYDIHVVAEFQTPERLEYELGGRIHMWTDLKDGRRVLEFEVRR